jgi:hypothetical protein
LNRVFNDSAAFTVVEAVRFFEGSEGAWENNISRKRDPRKKPGEDVIFSWCLIGLERHDHIRSFHDGRLKGHVLLLYVHCPGDWPRLKMPEDCGWRASRCSHGSVNH